MVPVVHQAVWSVALILVAFIPSAAFARPQAATSAAPSATDGFAEMLVTASPTEREKLLADEPSSITPELIGRLTELGTRSYNQNQYEAARNAYRAAEEIAAALHDEKAAARTLMNLGRVEIAVGDFARAREYLDRAHETSRRIGDDAGVARILGNLAVIATRQGNLDQALENYEAALAIHQRIGDDAGRAGNLLGLGALNFNRGRHSEAIALYRQSLEIRTALKDKAGMGATLNNLGTVYRDQGDYAHALDYYLKSLAIKEEVSGDSDVGYTLNNIGILYKEQGNYRQALDTYAKALARFESMNNRDGIGRVLVNTGVVYQAQADDERALAYYQRALDIKRTLNDKTGIAITLCNIGQVYQSRKAYADATAYYDKCLPFFEAVGDRGAVAEAFMYLADLHLKQGQYTQGLEMAERGTALAEQVGRDELVWQSRAIAATIHRAMNQPEKARAELEETIALIESLRSRVAGGQEAQQTYFESKLAPYHALVDLLVDRHQAADALAVAERARARVLLDVIRSGRVNITTAMTSVEKEQEQILTNRLVAVNAERFRARTETTRDGAQVNAIDSRLEQARLDLESFRTTLYASHPELRLRRAETPPMSIADARDLLPDAKTALLEFVVTDESTFLFVVRLPRVQGGGAQGGKPNEPRTESEAPVRIGAYRLRVAQKTLAERIERFRGRLGDVDNRFVRDARDLFDLLLAPAAADLRGATRLVIVPDGPLWELPFQVLRTAQSQDLIDRHTIFFAPSLSVLRESTRRRAQRGTNTGGPLTALAMGNPTLGGETLARVEALMDERLEALPEAERQVRALEQLYGAARTKVYVGDQAREEEFKAMAASFRVLHIATHGILNDRSPMYSHLVFAQRPGAAEDGLLEARELMQLDMTADVAVLSACETARGRVSRGEGMMGLTWALFVAGVPTTVVSQWKVRSDSTADLMIEFHRHLREQLARPVGQRDVADALRMAALKVKRDPRYRHPFHWAPFILVGDGY